MCRAALLVLKRHSPDAALAAGIEVAAAAKGAGGTWAVEVVFTEAWQMHAELVRSVSLGRVMTSAPNGGDAPTTGVGRRQ